MTAPAPLIPALDPALLKVDVDELGKQVNPLVARAESLVISDQEGDEAAQHDLVALKNAEKFIKTVFKGPKAALDKAHADMCEQEKTWLDPIQNAAKITYQKHSDYAAAEQAKAAQERRRLEEAAQKEEEEKREQEALRAEAAGDTDGAVQILTTPVDRPIVHVQAAVSKVRGVGATKDNWGAEVFDLKALIKHVAKNCDRDPGLMACLEAAMTPLNQMARAQKDMMSIPGVKAVNRKAMNIRTA